MAELTYDQLRDAVAGGAVALRSRIALQPAGGPGDKVMPPTYGVENSAANKYAVESRLVDDAVRNVVLLDSVASQANRLEIALLEGWQAGELSFPVPFVDFTVDPDIADLGRLTALEAPHRIADAIFRDSLFDGTLFRLSDVGRAITDARPGHATALLRYSPTALLFGMWDSTGPKGGLGSKFQRALVSEIVGLDAEVGVKVGSRIDPLQIERNSAVAFEHRDSEQRWTLDTSEAVLEKGKPKVVGKDGRPSEINHGNVTPTIDARSGGVTISRAIQTTVISLAALRRLHFPVSVDGRSFSPEDRRVAEAAARAAVGALGIAALAYQHELDYDLRSRCLLVPEHAPRVEILTRDGSEPTVVEVNRRTAAALLEQAATDAASHWLGWETGELRLVPAPKLVELIRRSRAAAAAEAPEAG